MISEREVWLKAMAIAGTKGKPAAMAAMATMVNSLGEEPEWREWLRVAAAVDAITDATVQ